jgi:hypothetical protein
MKLILLINELNVKRGKWVQPYIPIRGEELVDLVQTAYKRTPEGSFINSVGDLKPSEWLAKDFHNDERLDVSIFYRRARSGEKWKGNKIQGIGHDGSKEGKQIVLTKLVQLLKKRGWWIEASDKLEEVLYGMGVPYVKDEETLKTIYNDENLKMIGERGKYVREIGGGKKIRETTFGNPLK